MRPILFDLWGIHIHSYGAFLALGFLLGTYVTVRAAKARGIATAHVVDLALISCIASLIGSRLGFVLLEWEYYRQFPFEVFYITEGGLSFHGGLVGGVLAGIWFCRRRGISPWQMADLVAPAVALGTAVTRIGCLLNGCCYGYVTDLPIGMPVAIGDPSLRHPTQLYAAVLNFALYLYLERRRNHGHFAGYLAMVYLILYSLLRIGVEIFRESEILFGPVKIAQAASFVIIVAAAITIYVKERREYGIHKTSTEPGTQKR